MKWRKLQPLSATLVLVIVTLGLMPHQDDPFGGDKHGFAGLPQKISLSVGYIPIDAGDDWGIDERWVRMIAEMHLKKAGFEIDEDAQLNLKVDIGYAEATGKWPIICVSVMARQPLIIPASGAGEPREGAGRNGKVDAITWIDHEMVGQLNALVGTQTMKVIEASIAKFADAFKQANE